MKKWKIKDSRVAYKNKLFSIRHEKVIIPRTGKPYDYFYENSRDWVNVVPVTKEGKIILIRQYRHAVREFTLEIPGGIIDPEDKSSLAAAKRELLEETGYGNGKFELIGKCQPNPAIINNVTYTYLARGVEKINDQNFDGTEEIELFFTSPKKIDYLIRKGKIKHSLVLSAFYYAKRHLF